MKNLLHQLRIAATPDIYFFAIRYSQGFPNRVDWCVMVKPKIMSMVLMKMRNLLHKLGKAVAPEGFYKK